jgi:heme exporter protein C
MSDTPAVSGRDAPWWAFAAAVLMAVAIAGGFWVAPQDAEGEIQRLLFLHVPVAVVSLVAFFVAAIAGIVYLRRREERYSEVATISIGLGLLFVVLTMVSGAIWGKAFWGAWWRWDDPRLVTYLIIGLLYAAFFVLRSSTDESRRARFSAVYAIVAFASVPLSFVAVRQAQSFIHPVPFDSNTGDNVAPEFRVWLIIGFVAMTVLFVALLKLELLQRRTDRELGRLRLLLEERS